MTIQTTLDGLLLQREYAIASNNAERLNVLEAEIARLRDEIARSAVTSNKEIK